MPQVSPLHFGLPEAVPSRQTSLEEVFLAIAAEHEEKPKAAMEKAYA